jgi:hypothetical protein
MKTSGQSNTARTLGQSVFNKELDFRSRHCWEVSASRLDDVATCPDDVQYFKIFQISVRMWKDFSEDRPDAWSSCPDVNLIKIELRCF